MFLSKKGVNNFVYALLAFGVSSYSFTNRLTEIPCVFELTTRK